MSAPLEHVKYVAITPPGALLDNASATTAEVDTLGWEYLTIVCLIGATDIALTALAVTEADVSATNHANITGCVCGTSANIDGTVATLPSDTDDNKFVIFNIDLRGRKRYIDVTATFGNGSVGGYISIAGILSRGNAAPTTSAGMGAYSVYQV